ncbi:MAG: glycoside hydrolase family 28 protein [Bacteroidota bacterium]
MDIPQFPATTFDIRHFGAVPDGSTLNTRALDSALKACAAAGGGTVIVPPGTWLTGPIELSSNICLRLERGAVLQMSSRLEDFPLIPRGENEGQSYFVASPISARDARNIAITGEGIIDGAGEAWRYVLREKQTERQWNQLVSSGGVVTSDGKQWWPSKEALEGESYLAHLKASKRPPVEEDYQRVKRYLRPDLIRFVRCDGILLDGPTFRNSPRYHIHPIQCENIIIRNVQVQTPWYAMNGDGIDLSACRNVIVYNSTLDVGDDGICLKPSSPSAAQSPGPACSKIVIADCVVYHAHGGFVIGSESYGGVRDVSIRNCIFMDTDVGIRFKSARGRGGLVERVYVDGIQMRAIENEAILLDMYYSGGAPEVESTKDRSVRHAEPITARTPRFQDIVVKNVVCNGAARSILVNGLPEVPIKNIQFDSVFVTSRLGVLCIDAQDIRLNACRNLVKDGPAITVNEATGVVVTEGRYRSENGPTMKVEGSGSRGIRMVRVDADGKPVSIERGAGVAADAALVE